MDVRHESLKEGLLNHLITTINTYIHTNTDTLVVDDSLRSTIHDICRQIYSYLGVSVDINGILSKHNLLSIDTVLLPNIPDPEASKILKESDFIELLNEINSCINKLNETHPGVNGLLENLRSTLGEYRG